MSDTPNPNGRVLRPTGYYESISYYIKRFGLNESTVHRWMGYKAPLDDDVALDRWANARQRLPKGFFIPGKKHQSEPRPQPYSAPTRDPQGPQQPRESQAGSAPGSQEQGLRAEIGRLEFECAHLYETYTSAREQNMHTDALAAQTLWLRAQTNLMRMRKETPKSELEDAKTIPIVEVEAGFRRALKEMKTRLEMVPRRVVLNMKGLTPGALGKKWSAEIADVILELQLALQNLYGESADGKTGGQSGQGHAQTEDAPGVRPVVRGERPPE